ncbi:MAG TPA: hypothetical protein VLT87_27545 [Thermoanaerobaculia bacterium]|nr:hypothetical protein [Thermoanaerobaculia bacterium]
MTAVGEAAHRLTVERMDALYRLPAGHPQPAAARHRLDRLVAAELPRLLSSLLAPALPAGDPSLWLIRRLDVDLSCDLAAADDARLARAWAGEVGSALMRTLARGPDGETVLRFPDRASFLARFLTDLAAGLAWGRWYYACFESLRSLPTSAALREALLREPGEIPAVLARLLAAGDLEPILREFSDRSCEQLLAAALPTAGGDPDRGLLSALAGVAAPLPPPEPQALARAGLRLLAEATGPNGEILGRPGLAAGIAWIVGLAAALARMGEPGAFLAGLAAGDLTAAAVSLRTAGLPALLPLLPAWSRAVSGDRAWLDGLVRTLMAKRQAPAPAAESVAGLESDFAGVFFLLPSWLALHLETLLDELDRPRVRAALRWLALVKAFGRKRANAAFHDPALRLAAGLTVPPATALARLAEEPALGEALARALPEHLARQRRADDPIADRDREHLLLGDLPAFSALSPDLDHATALVANAVLRHFAGRLMGFGRSSAEHLVVSFLAGPGEVHARPLGYRVVLPRMPLAVVARMAGAHGLSCEIPWLGGAAVETELPGA